MRRSQTPTPRPRDRIALPLRLSATAAAVLLLALPADPAAASPPATAAGEVGADVSGVAAEARASGERTQRAGDETQAEDPAREEEGGDAADEYAGPEGGDEGDNPFAPYGDAMAPYARRSGFDPPDDVIRVRTEPAELELEPGERIDLSLRDADLRETLRSFARMAGFNVVLHPEVEGRVTVELRDVAWEEALATILRTHGLGAVVDDREMGVGPRDLVLPEKR